VFLKRELDAIETELERIRAVGGCMVASSLEEAQQLIAAFRQTSERAPVVIVTGVPQAEGPRA
jgi:hypothetical protein